MPMLLFAKDAETYTVKANGANFYQDSYNPSEASEVYTHPQTGSLFDSKLDLNSFNGVNFATYTGSTTGTGTDLDTELDTDDPWIDVYILWLFFLTFEMSLMIQSLFCLHTSTPTVAFFFLPQVLIALVL